MSEPCPYPAYTGKIRTLFTRWTVSGKPYKICYYLIGGPWRVPVSEIDENGNKTGRNSSAGFHTLSDAIQFYMTGKPSYAIY